MSSSYIPVPPDCPLSHTEFKVALLLVQGMTYKEIAQVRNRSVSTIRAQLHTAYKRVKASNGPQLIAIMVDAGWTDPVNTEWVDNRLTAAQSLYIAAFERWLYDPSEEHVYERAFWLRGIFYEARITPPWEVLGIPQPTKQYYRAEQ